MKWQPALKQSIGDYTVLVPYFENGYQFNGSQIWFSKSVETSSLVNESSLVLENLQTEVLSNSELADLDKEFIVDGLQYSLRNALSRKRNYAQIRVSPIFKDGNQYRKVYLLLQFLQMENQFSLLNLLIMGTLCLHQVNGSALKWRIRVCIESPGLF
ncbi:hypothetical protein JCM19314_3255 [Nonlabens ulvanivorans]|uniref:Uncharacterized protein n=1 Tax=Nonlabens ulvanivorans TaxID=906888 RepID=A0A090Q811_NONUL|nr:hypothetical protein [Nonlabens ulvanivorans]GAK99224.1 hypothetical protein JCM19314_3255 [Nonlabens ulvanivorans]